MIELGPLCQRYLGAQLEGNGARAIEVIDEALRAGVPVARVQLEIVQSAQYEIGRLWETNAIGVSAEHQATVISQLALAALYDRLPRPAHNGKCVLVACVEGELHDMGARIASDFLEMAGFDVRFLGANVAPEALARKVEEARPQLVALSTTMSFHRPALQQSIARIRETSQGHVPILVGGRALSAEELASCGLDVQGIGANAVELVDEALRLTGCLPNPAPPSAPQSGVERA